MKQKILCGLSSAFFPLGLYAAVGQQQNQYQRRTLSAQIAAAEPGFNGSLNLAALSGLKSSQKIQTESQVDGLAIIAGVPVRELLVLDGAVPNKEVFYRSIKPGVAIAEINSAAPGLPQLTAILQQYKNLAAVHLVSHAEAGVLLLGNSRINAESFKADIKAFAAIDDAMAVGADLLLYGCNLAADLAGSELLSLIKNNSHVDVAASNNATGAVNLGGDWQLEIQQGKVEAGLPVNERALKDFTAILGTYAPSNFCNPSNGGAYRTSISSLTSQDGAYVVTTKTLAGGAVNFNCAQQGLLAYTFSPNANAHSIYIRKPGGGTFKISSMKLYGGCPTVHAYAINSSTTTASSLNNATIDNGFTTVNDIVMTNLTGVTMDTLKLKLTGSCTTYMGIGNFSVPDPNSAPTNISLSASTVNQSASANATVGTLSSTDPDSGNTFTYSLVSGTGSTDNASFNISGSSLRATSPSSLSAGSKSVRVRTTDQGGLTFEKAFTITVVDNVAPTVSSVSASTANGTYKVGDTVSVQVNFSEAVTVTGTPQLTLETGSTDRAVNYASGSGTTALTFTYTVQAGDTSADLDYTGTTALALNSGTIKDAANNNATLTLASPGAANSLGANKALVIDGVAPSVSSVSATTSNGTYKTGDVISLQVNFSETVTVTGTPQLTLETGTTDRAVNYSSGTGTSSLTFNYTVQAGDISADLDYLSTSALALNGGTILDGAGNAASLTLATPGAANSLGNAKALVVDTSGPSATITLADTSLKIGDTSLVTITFNEAVTGFTNADLTLANGTLSSVSSSDGGVTWTATFTPSASITAATNLISLDNTGVTDSAGNAGTGSTDSNNYAIDTVRPTASITLADSNLAIGETSLVTITFSEAVSGFTNGDLTIANGTLSSVSSSDGGVTWTATFTPTASITDATNVITLDNTGISDTAGNAGSGSTDSNNYAIDAERPSASIVVASSSLKAGETSLVTITFSEAVTGFTNGDLSVVGGTLSTVSSSDGGITWTATFTPNAGITDATNLITLDNSGVTDTAGNSGSGSTDSNNYAIDTARPTASIALADSALKAGETSLVTITFSRPVSGFTNADLSVAGGTLSAVSSSDGGTTWTATFTPSNGITSASNLISLDNTGVTDAAGNTGSGSTDSANYSIDTQRPSASLVLTDTNLSLGETSLLTITFSEAVTGFTNSDLSVAGGTLSAVSSSDGGVTWTATFTPNASTATAGNLISLDVSGVIDGAGNSGSGTTDSNSYAVDTQRPTATITLADSALKLGDTSLVTISFSEAVSGFSNADLSVAGGTLSSVSSSDGGTTWTATFTPNTGITSASNLISLDNSGVTDAAGNPGSGNSDSANYSIDTQRPTANLVVADNNLAVGETSLVTITFSEAVSGFTNADLTVAGGTLSTVSSSDGGITWTATLTPNPGTSSGNLISLDTSGVSDAAGNSGSGSSSSNAYAIDGERPTATLLVANSNLKAGETSLVTITFSEAVSGFTNADLTVSGGTLSAVSSSDGGITWTATLTPSVSTTSSGNLISLDASGVTDTAGNAGTGTSSSNTFAIDTQRPTATLLLADSSLTAGETSLFTVTFSRPVSGFSNADLTLSGGTLSAVSSSDGGTTWTATFTPNAGSQSTGNLLVLDMTGVTDSAGNTGTGTSSSNAFALDTLRPTATVVLADANLTLGETSLLTITFSEAVTSFTNADLTVAGGSLSNVTSSDGGITWTATFTPNAGTISTGNLISLDLSGVSDVAGNSGAGNQNSNAYAINNLRPGAGIVVADSVLSIGETSLVTITFTHAVTGFTNGDLTVAGGTLSAVSSSDGGITWTATFTPTAGITNANALIQLDNSGVTDTFGNPGTGSVNSNSFAIDTQRPSATLLVADSNLKAGETSLVTITFSEAVSGFNNADLSLAGGSLSNVSSTDGGITWTATFTPTADTTSASNLISLDATGVADSAGNSGSGSINSNSYAVDTVRPSASLVMADSNLKLGETSLLTITFTRPVSGLTNADLTISGGTLSTLTSSDGGTTWTASFTPSNGLSQSGLSIDLDASGVTDSAGNTGTGSLASNSFNIDTQRPTASIALADTALAVGETSLVTITFSEAVTGFSNGDLTVAGGTLSNVTSSDGGITWTATFTPTSGLTSASNIIELDTSGVMDLAGNAGSGSSQSPSFAIDATRPSLHTGIAVSDTNLKVRDTATVTFTFSEAVTGFTLADITAASGTLSNLTSSDGGITWTATLTPNASTESASNLISLNLADITDLAGNSGAGINTSANYLVDTRTPSMAAPIALSDSSLKIGETAQVSFVFSEAVNGFSVDDISVDGGSLSNLTSLDGGISWTATFTPSSDETSIGNRISVDLNGVSDSAGNSGSGNSRSPSFAVDTQVPSLIGPIAISDTNLGKGESATLTFTFSEAVTGFSLEDIQAPNGTVTNLVSNDGGITWTATFTPNGDTAAATNAISLNLADITDSAGNSGSGSVPSANYAVDTARPSLISIVLADRNLQVGETSLVTFTFSEAVSGFELSDLTVPGGTLSNLASSDGGITWKATFTPNANSTSSGNQISLDMSGISDLSGNSGSGSSSSEAFAVDTAGPVQPAIASPSQQVYTNKASQLIQGSHTENGVTIKVYLDADRNGEPDSNTPVGTSLVSSGQWSLTLPLAENADNKFIAIAEDSAGNRALALAIPTITQDVIAPVAPTGTDLAAASDTGSSNSDKITNQATPTLAGRSEPNANITITSDVDGLVGMVQADGEGNWSLSLDRLTNGKHQLSAAAADAAGNMGEAAAPLAITIDTRAPALSPIAAQRLALGTSSPLLPISLSDNLSDATSLVLQARSSNTTAVPVENLVVSGSGASRGLTITPAAAGTASISLEVTDLAGNSASISFNLLTNTLPSISGSPSLAATANTAYRFAPVVQDADANSLSFSVTNLPKWASFNAATGVLSGTPTGADLGASGEIVISVSDGFDSVSLPGFSINVAPPADTGLPILTVPKPVALNANALYTPVTLQQLLGLADSANQATVDATLAGLAVDSLRSNQCCTLRPEGLNEEGRLLLPPGRHEVVWKATNTKGQSVEGKQVLELRPLVSFSKSQEALRGSTVYVRVLLNGPAPSYPLEVPYSIDASSSASEAEYILTDGVVTFTKENPLEVIIPVNLLDVKGLPDSKLVLSLGDNTTNLGVTRTHTISLKEGNVAPSVVLKLQQGGINTSLITPDGGPVTATAVVTDLNPDDSHSFDWSASDKALVDTDGNASNASLVFDPQALSGVHSLLVSVTDSQGASAKTQLNFNLAAKLPTLEVSKDSDQDGISDAAEGLTDSNGNGIPDYLDNLASNNLLPQVGTVTQAYLLECDPGVRCGLGEFVLGGTTGGAQILDNEVTSLPGLAKDNAFTPVGGIFDFVANDLPLAGQALRIVIPQKAPIPTNAVYRKFDKTGWRNFVENASNSLHSTRGQAGFCPPPGDASWEPGLKPGYYCVQLTLEDGGPNDTDGLVNAAIADPGFVGVEVDVEPPPPAPVHNITSTGKKRGGSLDASLLALLGLLVAAQARRRRLKGTGISITTGALVPRRKPRRAAPSVLAASLVAASSLAAHQAQSAQADWLDNTYVRINLLSLKGGENEADFSRALAATSPSFSLQRYDIDRTGWDLSLGKSFTEHWAVELGYKDLGKVQVDFASRLETPTATAAALADHYPHASGGWTLAGAYRYSLGEQLSLMGRAGLYRWQSRVDINTPSIAPPEQSGTDLFAGLELQYAITPQVGIGATLEQVFVADGVTSLGFGVRWSF
ncbi:MAG: Ig-like domain-containing protein [Marinagarivorans sp.]